MRVWIGGFGSRCKHPFVWKSQFKPYKFPTLYSLEHCYGLASIKGRQKITVGGPAAKDKWRQSIKFS